MTKRGIDSTELYQLKSVANPQLSPDGKNVYSLKHPLIKKNKHMYPIFL